MQRLAKLALDESKRPTIDPEFEEATEGEEVERKERFKTRWAQLEAIVGTEKRLKLVARNIVAHFEERLEALDGKAMVVCMSRRICGRAETAVRVDAPIRQEGGWCHVLRAPSARGRLDSTPLALWKGGSARRLRSAGRRCLARPKASIPAARAAVAAAVSRPPERHRFTPSVVRGISPLRKP